jgi:hypothetical protein
MRLSFDDLERRKKEREAAEASSKVRLGDVLERIRQNWRAQRGCPDDETLAGYADETLRKKPRQWDDIQAHVTGCALCRRDVKAIQDALGIMQVASRGQTLAQDFWEALQDGFTLLPRFFEPAFAFRGGAESGIGEKLGNRIPLRGEECYLELYAGGVRVVSREEQPPSVRFINREGNVEEITAQERELFLYKWREWQLPLSGQAGFRLDPDQNVLYIMEGQENEDPSRVIP